MDTSLDWLIGEWRSFNKHACYTQSSYAVDLKLYPDGKGEIVNTRYQDLKTREVKVFSISYSVGKKVMLPDEDEAYEINLFFEDMDVYKEGRLTKSGHLNGEEGTFSVVCFEDENTLYMPSRDGLGGDSEESRITWIDKKQDLTKYMRVEA